MVDLTTTNYGWTKPTTGADIGTWGPIVNTNYDNQDTALKAVSVVANAALPLAGGTMTGPLVGINARFDCTTGGAIPFAAFSRGASLRWVLSTDTTAESGGNASSNLSLAAYADNGTTLLSYPIQFTRSTGLVTCNNNVAVVGNLTVSGSITGTFTIASNSVTPAMLTTGHPSWDSTGLFTVTGSTAGPIYAIVTNSATGAAVQARLSLSTGTANSQVFHNLADSSGAPTYQVTVGSAVAAIFTDIDTQVWRTRLGAERMRLSSGGLLGIGTASPMRPLHLAGPNSVEESFTATAGQANFRTWNTFTDGGGGIKANWSLRLVTDDHSGVQLTAMLASGATGVVNFPQGLTSNGTAVVLASDGRMTGLPINVINTSFYTVQPSDWGGCIHVQTNCTVTVPGGVTVGVCFEVSCDPGVTVTFSYGGTARTVPANGTGGHSMVGPASAFIEQKKPSEIWLRGDAA